MKTVTDPQKEIPVIHEADVIVVGGGPAGVGAALAAARNNAKTVLIEKFNCLGGAQTLLFNSTFSFVDPEIQGGIIQDIIKGLKQGDAMYKDKSEDARKRRGFGAVFFDSEYYKFLLDTMMEDAGVTILYHAYGVGAIKEGNCMRGIFIETLEGKRAVLGKVVIDCTGSAEIAWKSGAPCLSDGFPSGPGKGRHIGYGYTFLFGNVDIARLKQLRKEQPEEWGALGGVGRNLWKKATADGRLHGNRDHFLLTEVYRHNRVWILGPHYPLPLGQDSWAHDNVSKGEIDLRKQIWSMYRVFKEEVPGFENSYIEKSPATLLLRDAHRIVGDYVLKEEDIRQGKSFDDAIAISNMPPDIVGPDHESNMVNNLPPYDIPYRSLVSKETDGLLGAGSAMSADFIVYCATRYCTPSICTGQAAGTAAALSVKHNVVPKKLDVKELQKTLQDQGARTSVRNVPAEVLEEYEKSRLEYEKRIGIAN